MLINLSRRFCNSLLLKNKIFLGSDKMFEISHYWGEIAAIATVLCYTICTQCFEAAGKRIGTLSSNLIRLWMALLLFCATMYLTKGTFFPVQFSMVAWLWLGASGIIGFSIGDLFLFKAFVEIGPRITMLIFSLSAPFTAIIGWLFLNEHYTLYQWLGMAVTLIGVAMVILEKEEKNEKVSVKRKTRKITPSGILFGFGGMMGQAIGYIFSKIGMNSGNQMLDPFASTQIRVIAGIIGFIIIFTLMGYWHRIIPAIKHKGAMGFLFAGAFLGPFLGVALSLLALHYTTTGVATTIMALTPVLIIPFSVYLHKEHVSYRGFLGALVAFTGTALLIIRF